MIFKLELPIEITQENGLIIAICPIFNVGSQGRTELEALDNAKEALEVYLEDGDVQSQANAGAGFVGADKCRVIQAGDGLAIRSRETQRGVVPRTCGLDRRLGRIQAGTLCFQ